MLFVDSPSQLILRGERVHSRRRVKVYEPSELPDDAKKILECLPLYPKTISTQEISTILNIPARIVLSKLTQSGISNNYPVCDIEDNRWCLISKEALS